MPQNTPYFVSGHTADGYVNYLASNIKGIKDIVVLRNGKDAALEIIAELIEIYNEEQLEIISDPAGRNKFAGIIMRDRKQAVLSDSIVQHEINGAHIIDLQIPENYADEHYKESCYKEAYDFFNKGLLIHDELEKVYINEMDFAKADDVAFKFIDKLLKGTEPRNRQAHVYERLFGTNTPDGMLNHVRELINPIKRVYHIKGRAGTGKSVFMRKVLHACIRYGFDCELYYCSFDSKSIDMVIVRDLDFCIFDSTSPHEFSPVGPTEEVIDLYQLAVNPGTDKRHKKQIESITARYKAEMKNGLNALQKLTSLSVRKVQTEEIDKVLEEILSRFGTMQ